jgi:hypothetical protein
MSAPFRWPLGALLRNVKNKWEGLVVSQNQAQYLDSKGCWVYNRTCHFSKSYTLLLTKKGKGYLPDHRRFEEAELELLEEDAYHRLEDWSYSVFDDNLEGKNDK